MNTERRMPFSTAELIELDERGRLEQDARPWGRVNDNAFAFFSNGKIIVESAGVDGGCVLRSPSPIFEGLPLLEEELAAGIAIARTPAERIAVRQRRRL